MSTLPYSSLKRSTKPMKRGRIRSKTSARRKKQVIDLHVKQQVAERDGKCCVKCGATEKLQAAHILPKGLYPRLRFAQLNLLTLCIKCHLYWAHKDPLAFAAWLNEEFPGLEAKLREMAHVALKPDLEALYQEASKCAK